MTEEDKQQMLAQKEFIMKKTISGIMCGIIVIGLLAGCAGVSESNPSEKKTILTESKIYQEIILIRLSNAIKKTIS